MAEVAYKIPYFGGVNQALDEEFIQPYESPDAVNIDTEGGNFRRKKGHKKWASVIPYITIPEQEEPDTNLPPHISKIEGIFSSSTSDSNITDPRTLYAVVLEKRGNGTPTRQLYSNYLSGGWNLNSVSGNLSARINDIVNFQQGDAAKVIFANSAGLYIESDSPAQFDKVGSITAKYLAVHAQRLFYTDPAHPYTIYYSKPLDATDFTANPDDAFNSGGEFSLSSDSGGEIISIDAYLDDLVIMRTSGFYKLMGTNPATWEVKQVPGDVMPFSKMYNGSSTAEYDGIVYFMTRKGGIGYYDGNKTALLPESQKLRKLWDTFDYDNFDADNMNNFPIIVWNQKLYIAVRYDFGSYADGYVIEFDLKTLNFMICRGVIITGWTIFNNKLLFVSDNNKNNIYEYEGNYTNTFDSTLCDVWKLANIPVVYDSTGTQTYVIKSTAPGMLLSVLKAGVSIKFTQNGSTKEAIIITSEQPGSTLYLRIVSASTVTSDPITNLYYTEAITPRPSYAPNNYIDENGSVYAYWKTPKIGIDDKSLVKKIKQIRLYGSGATKAISGVDTDGQLKIVGYFYDSTAKTKTKYATLSSTAKYKKVTMNKGCRHFQLMLSNDNNFALQDPPLSGYVKYGYLELLGGIQIDAELDED